MSGSDDSTGETPIPNGKCPTCGVKKIPLKIRAGKYASLAAIVTIITQVICSLDIEVIP